MSLKGRMHIAHFSNTYYPVTSGVVRSVSTFRRALTELGHNVFIFSQQSSDYQDKEPFIFRYAAIDLPMFHDFPVTIPISPFVDKLLPPLKLDVIHSHHPFLLGQTAARKAKELGLPLVFTFHTRYQEYGHYVSLNQKLVKEAITRWLGEYMEKCHHIVVPSQSIQQILGDTYGITEQVTAIPTGIDLEPFQQADGQAVRKERGWGNDLVLISIGRLAKEKNWKTLVTAVAQVMKERSDIRLVAVGDGEERKSLRKYTQELGIANQVEFTGNIPFDDIPRYLRAADIFCFASITETQGLVTMEAMAAQLPVVAVDATGTSDVVTHGQDGLLTENNSDALAQALQRVIDDEALRQKLKEGAIERAKSLEMKVQAQKLVEVYQQAKEAQKAKQFVPVNVDKKLFKWMDEEQWTKLFGLS